MVGIAEHRDMLEDNGKDKESSDLEPQFQPLNATLSYSVSDAPPALELLRTEDIVYATQSMSGMQKLSYGGPKEINHNPRHVRVSGKNVTQKHSQYALTAGMMLGIRECVGGFTTLMEEVDDDVDCANIEEEDEDGEEGVISDSVLSMAKLNEERKRARRKKLEQLCAKVQKFRFPAGQHCIPSQPDKPLPYAYKFKAYAPLIFSKIRNAFGVEKQHFLHSICGNFNFIEFMSNAKSGQFFFYSHDGQYMIKTQTYEECKFLRYILPSYYSYLMKNPHSFLTHYYGMYRVKMPATKTQLHFVIMKSVFNTEREIHKIWDLKGSTKGRRASRGDTVHKDLDMLEEGRKLHVGKKKKTAMINQLTEDANFLSRLGIMDYSLLVGVHHRLDNDASFTKDANLTAENIRKNATSVSKENNSPQLMRTNTPLRRQQLLQQNERSQVHETNEAFEFDSVLFSNSASDLSGRRDDDSCSSDDTNEMTLIWNDASKQHLPLSPLSVSMTSASFGEKFFSPNPYTSRDDLGIESVTEITVTREIYFCGIIDILQQYNARKWGETVIKKAAGGTDSEISCVDPETYANRFVDFMTNLIK